MSLVLKHPVKKTFLSTCKELTFSAVVVSLDPAFSIFIIWKIFLEQLAPDFDLFLLLVFSLVSRKLVEFSTDLKST